MRTKTLLLTAALSAAGLLPSMAQVFSVNAVGYVNITVPANGYMMVANPLVGNPNNNLDNILPLPSGFTGTSVFRFNAATQGYYDTMQWLEGVGWLAGDENDKVIAPGEGFFVQNIQGGPLNVTFVGEVQGGTSQNPITGNNAYSLRSAIVPKGGPLGWVGLANSLEFPADSGDSIFVFDEGTQQYKPTYQYLEGVGWLHDFDPVEGPNIQPGRSFFVQKVAPTRNWTMAFSVN
jgi:hypothetical protein